MLSRFLGNSCLMNNVYISSSGLTAGKMEGEGPLKQYFDKIYTDHYCHEKTYEKAERKMMQDALSICLDKEKIKGEDVDLYIGSDLLNQNVTVHYLLRHIARPSFAVYGACSGFALTAILASLLIDANYVKNVMTLVSSHNATAERQYRYPVEYGIQKKITTTFTSTGAVATLFSNKKSDIKVEALTMGRIVDYQQNDPNDMGGAMAPAAYDTIKNHFKDLNRSFDDYDLVVTGDLSKYGHQILKEMFKRDNIDAYNLDDCGKLLYNDNQEVFQGGSGVACSALVSMGYIYHQLLERQLKRVLIVSTGALLSPMMTYQKETIPTIAHAISLEVDS
jgi:stage V sporulation protein AD